MDKDPTWRPPDQQDWLYKVWEEDNHRDALQHLALLRFQGRKVTARQGIQDYFRTQDRQRKSRDRFFSSMRRECHGQMLTDEDITERPAICRADASNLQETLTSQHYQALFLCAGMELTHAEAAECMGVHKDTVRSLIRRALEVIRHGTKT